MLTSLDSNIFCLAGFFILSVRHRKYKQSLKRLARAIKKASLNIKVVTSDNQFAEIMKKSIVKIFPGAHFIPDYDHILNYVAKRHSGHTYSKRESRHDRSFQTSEGIVDYQHILDIVVTKNQTPEPERQCPTLHNNLDFSYSQDTALNIDRFKSIYNEEVANKLNIDGQYASSKFVQLMSNIFKIFSNELLVEVNDSSYTLFEDEVVQLRSTYIKGKKHKNSAPIKFIGLKRIPL